ncbi:g4019 [Coccomyxa elongata]
MAAVFVSHCTAKVLRLLSKYPDLLLVEASSKVGGRVQQVEGIVPWPVQLGPEFVHGAKSSLKGLLQEINCSLRELEWPDYWYFGADRKLVSGSAKDEELERLHELFASVGKRPRPQPDISARDWLQQEGASERMLAVADACYANDFGCSLHQLGLSEMITENQRWDSGETYLILDRPLAAVVQHLHKAVEQSTQLGWPVSKIEHSSAGAKLYGPSGNAVECRHVIVTVPILMLQQERLRFSPPLPADKRGAISRVKMSNAMKVILAFSRPFWPADFFDVVCTDCFMPEFWVTEYPATCSDPATAGLCCITGFVAGAAAEEMSRLSQTTVVTRSLAQLDRIFGTAERRHPATAAFVRAHVEDWSRSRYIGGAYSYPSLGAWPGDRETLAAPVGDVLFFAGEATHPAVNPCMQAALETGERAAAQVLRASERTPSKL